MFQADYTVRSYGQEARGQIRLKDKRALLQSLVTALDFETPNGFDTIEVKMVKLNEPI